MATKKQSATKKKAAAVKAAGRAGGRGSAAGLVDAQLARYRSMRDFSVTAEPAGGIPAGNKGKKAAGRSGTKAAGAGLPFVIQKHAASHLHYDFRLGWNGVLKSWACAKGPSYSPKDRRLAVQVEDHPMEYGGFEGVIPKGQYGGGTVMVWDQGTWRPQPGHEDVDGGLRDGSLKFEMFGTKMKGKWTLVRMNGRAAKESKPNWLLIKEHDPFERDADATPITEESPASVVTGRSLEQIGAAEDHVWQSNKTAYLRDPAIKVPKGRAWQRQKPRAKPAAGSAAAGLVPTVSSYPLPVASMRLCPKEAQPTFVKPELALEATAPPEGPDWLHELKLDGYRMQARKAGKKVAMLTRSGLDWTHRVPTLAAAVAALPVGAVTLDGEAVVLAADGTTSFADLQASFQDGAANPLTYFAFDLLHLEGHSTRGLALRERKELLAEVLGGGDGERLRLSEHIEGKAETIFHHACELGAEGIVSKRADAPYRGTRSAEWLKSKCLREQEFVVAGYTLSSEGDDRMGSLLLGYYDDARRLIYAGRTGTGFTQKLRRDLLTKLAGLKTEKSALEAISTADRRGALWVRPELVAQVRFATWTTEGLVRQAAFLGLREDKKATEVRREEPTVAPKPKHHASHRVEDSAKAAKSMAAKSMAKAGLQAQGGAMEIRLTHPDKVLDVESGLTKRQLADYYAAVAPMMLPQIADRPLSLVRCPDGTAKPCFFQKHANRMLPPGIGSIAVPDKKTGVPEPYITLNAAEQLASLAQLGVLELHPWGSRNDDLEHPDRLIFDLDPDVSIPWATLAAAAADVRKRLKKLGLESFLKLTGGKGLHIVAPIAPTVDWTAVKTAAHRFVLAMERSDPKLYLTKMSKAAREGKIYLDYLRNERGATAVAPFSPRARAGVHVSLPLPWTALRESALPVFRVRDFAEWSDRLRSDPWRPMVSTVQRLDPEKFDAL